MLHAFPCCLGNNKLDKTLSTSARASCEANSLLISRRLKGDGVPLVLHSFALIFVSVAHSSQPTQHSPLDTEFLVSSCAPKKVMVEISSSPPHRRPMYEDSQTIKSWVEAVYYAGDSETTSDVSDGPDTMTFVHPAFRKIGHLSACDSDLGIPVCLDGPSWLSDLHLTSYDDSDDSGTTSAFSDESAQYIRISSDSPWYRLPESRPEPTPSPEFDTRTFPNCCSAGVQQAIAQQELLLAIFHAELQRMIPRDGKSEYNPDWLDDVDPEVVLSPMEVYEDLCWRSAVSDKYAARQLTKPLADVPIGFADVHVAF